MKCSDCPMRMVPFFYCSRFIGCNLDGELPPIHKPNEAKDTV